MLHGELLVPGLILLVLGVLLIAAARFWPESGKAVVTARGEVETMPVDAGQAREITGPVTPFARAITWPSLVDPGAGTLDEPERRRVLEGLGIVGDAWSASILARAFEEEDGELRVMAIESLGRCDGDVVAPTLERAYRSYVIAERYAAIDGASRRGDLALLESGLRDTDGTVALAAAYGLHRAGRDDVIGSSLADREDARANEIRRILLLLTSF